MAHFYVQLLWDRTLLFVFLLTDFLILFFIGTSWYALETPTELKYFNHHWPFIGLGDLSNTRDNLFIDNLQVGITIICEGHSFRNVTRRSKFPISQPQFMPVSSSFSYSRSTRITKIIDIFSNDGRRNQNLASTTNYIDSSSSNKIINIANNDGTFDLYYQTQCNYISDDYSIANYAPDLLNLQCSLTSYLLLTQIIATMILIYRVLAGFYFTTYPVEIQLRFLRESSLLHSMILAVFLTISVILWATCISKLEETATQISRSMIDHVIPSSKYDEINQTIVPILTLNSTYSYAYLIMICLAIMLVAIVLTPKIFSRSYLSNGMVRTLRRVGIQIDHENQNDI